MKELTITMPKSMYKAYMKDGKDENGRVVHRRLETEEDLITYLQETWRPLGTIAEIRVEDGV